MGRDPKSRSVLFITGGNVRNFVGALSLFVFILSFASISVAGSITVNPTKLYLSGRNKTDVLKLKNDGDEKVTLQVEGMKWSQDEEGKDNYEPTGDIVFFPKIFTIEEVKETLMRVGMNGAGNVAKEGSYRVFLQEIPVSKPGESQLLLALRISVPLFIKPPKEVKEWAVEKAEFSGDALVVKIRNTGNSHISIGRIKVRGLDASGGQVFQREVPGWYVLPGVVRAFGIKISRQDCLNSDVFMVSAEEGRSVKEMKLDVNTTLNTTLCPAETERAAQE